MDNILGGAHMSEKVHLMDKQKLQVSVSKQIFFVPSVLSRSTGYVQE